MTMLRLIVRFLGWSLFLAFLGCVGWGLHWYLPPQPRWSCMGDFEIRGFLPDSSGVVLLETPEPKRFNVVVRDARSGFERGAYAQRPRQDKPVFSDNLRFALLSSFWNDEATFVNLETGSQWTAELDLWNLGLSMSEEQDLLLVRRSWSNCLLDARTGQVLDDSERSAFQPFSAITPTHVVTALPDGGLHLFERKTGRKSDRAVPGRALAMAPDGKIIAMWEKAEGARHGKLILWDFPEFAKSIELQTETPGAIACFSPDSKRLAICPDTRFDLQKLELWDVAEPRRVKTFPGLDIFEKEGEFASFSADSQLLAISSLQFRRPEDPLELLREKFTICDARTGSKLWNCSERMTTFRAFAPMSRTSVQAFGDDDEGTLEVVDARTRTPRLLITNSGMSLRPAICKLSHNRRFVTYTLVMKEPAPGKIEALVKSWLPASWFPDLPRHVLQAIDIDEAKLILDERVPADQALMSDDGRYLVTRFTDNEVTTLNCWDVPLGRLWVVIVGIPAGLGLLVAGWRWRRARKKSRRPQPAPA